MCAICGILNLDGQPVAEARLLQLRDVMVNRGPDHGGAWVSGPVGLGHRRLRILDLSPLGNQPMTNEDETVWVVFNGEIYNFPALRRELVAAGHQFRSQSDTEVILHGYEQWGDEVVGHLDGMFAFGLWDTKRQRLLLARDRFGKKPLFYQMDARQLRFASEFKALWSVADRDLTLDHAALDCYLHHLAVPQQHCVFKEIHKLQPGHYAVFTGAGIQVKQYWHPTFSTPEKASESEWIERIETTLREAVRKRLLSDVPLGAFLSGGVDSSVVVALMSQVTGKPVKTFSIGFAEQDFSELDHARKVADRYQTEHHEIRLQPKVLDILPALVWEYGEPFGDSSAIPTFYVSQAARQHVTVALSGDGGDELFGGYDIARAAWHAERFQQWCPGPVRQGLESWLLKEKGPGDRHALLHKLKTLLVHAHPDPRVRHSYSMAFTAQHKRDLYTAEFRARLGGHYPQHVQADWYPQLSGMRLVDQHLLLTMVTRLANDYLVKVDVASMKVALELRSPLLDLDLFNLTGRISPDLKVSGGRQKYLLKKVAERLLPHDVIYRRKQGFALPLKHWLAGDLAPVLQRHLPDGFLVRQGWFQREAIQQMLAAHTHRTADHTHRLWSLLWLELWCRMFLERSFKPTDSLS